MTRARVYLEVPCGGDTDTTRTPGPMPRIDPGARGERDPIGGDPLARDRVRASAQVFVSGCIS